MNMVTKVSYTNNDNDFLIAPELAFALSVQIGNDGVTAGSDGRKVIKAGTPLYVASGKNILEDRDEVMTVKAKESETNNVLCGIARHTIDVTNGTVNDALLIAGYVDLYKLDSTVQTALTTAIKTSLSKITFIKGAK